MIYGLEKKKIRILNLAVDPEFRRQGVGTFMAKKLINKLSPEKRKDIITIVRETNLPAQLFFKNQRFRATEILRNHYERSDEDGYVMVYSLFDISNNLNQYRPRNRISRYYAA